jgi:hypothetical protein
MFVSPLQAAAEIKTFSSKLFFSGLEAETLHPDRWRSKVRQEK